MSKYVVIKPLSQVTPEKGFQSFTIGDLIELDEKDAARMIEAGIVAPAANAAEATPKTLEADRIEPIETAEAKPVGVEKAVKAKGAKK